ncbi:MAG: hypothetical protein K1X92_07330 [Bacteroidia bacterium]|nr:hypothetical protein [Bacteroidia bacterium]
MREFQKKTDEIAITIPYFELKKSGDFLGGMSEPYIISIAVSESTIKDGSSTLHLNNFYFPNIKKCTRVNFGGVGRVIYGPQNPGKFVTYSILFMESDEDVRTAGENLSNFMNSTEIKAISKVLSFANPTYGAAAEVVRQIGSLVGKFMKKNKDDELFRVEGTLLRDTEPPYYIGDTYESFNKFVYCPVHVMPVYLEEETAERELMAFPATGIHTFGKLPVNIKL